jgi:transcription elongation factor Elf1
MKKKARKRRNRSRALREEAAYFCDACGEQIVVPLDVSAGASQEYVEDCPVCCRPNVIHVEVDEDGTARVWAERE